jgi:CubicO group peptidase (beta-lactamase class C family)
MFTKNSYLTLLATLGLLHSTIAQTITRLDRSKISPSALDHKIKYLMKAANVHGLAITIFNKNEVVYKKAFGYKKFDTKEPLKTNTNIYGASLSKAVFAVLVMKLVEEGVIDLDKPLQDYLPKPIYEYKPATKWHDNYSDLKTNTLYKKITARMCLSHTSGFPNWRWDLPGEKLSVTRTPGEKYGYSGEGLVYLQVVLEKITGRSLENLMQQKIFKPLGMLTSSYTWQPAFEKNYSFGHGATGKILEKDKDNEARSASTLETTLDDYTRFTKAVLKNTLIKSSSTKEMFSPQIRIKSVQQHGPLRLKDSTANDNIDLSYGLGWVLLQSPYGVGAFKEGHGDGFQHYSIIFPKQGTGIIIMANSDNAESIFKELLQTAIADTFTPWYWENYIPYPHPLKGSNRTSSPALLHQGREGRSTFLILIRQLSKDLSNANGSPLHCVERGRGEGARDLEIGF